MLRIARLRSRRMNASGSRVCSSANESARASTWRDSALPAHVAPKLTSDSASATAGSAAGAGRRSAPRRGRAGPPSAPPAAGRAACRRGPRSRSTAARAAGLRCCTWPSSWATTDRTWSGGIVVDQVVVQHHPLGVPDPAHVGVDGGGPPAGIHPVDLAHVDARAIGQLQHLGAQLAARHAARSR